MNVRDIILEFSQGLRQTTKPLSEESPYPGRTLVEAITAVPAGSEARISADFCHNSVSCSFIPQLSPKLNGDVSVSLRSSLRLEGRHVAALPAHTVGRTGVCRRKLRRHSDRSAGKGTPAQMRYQHASVGAGRGT
jgi:hypothetical protein